MMSPPSAAPERITMTLRQWEKIESRFSPAERAAISSAVRAETFDARAGWELDPALLGAELRATLTRALKGCRR